MTTWIFYKPNGRIVQMAAGSMDQQAVAAACSRLGAAALEVTVDGFAGVSPFAHVRDGALFIPNTTEEIETAKAIYLDGVREAKWAQVRAARYAAEHGGFTWDGSVFDSDLASQSKIQGAVQLAQMALAAQDPFELDWTLQDNTMRTLSAEDMIAVGVALGQHVAAQHATGRELRAAINDPQASWQDIEAVAWPT